MNPFIDFCFGILYYCGLTKKRNIGAALSHMIVAAKNGIKKANFIIGFIYHEGWDVKRDINKAINYYKEGSSFNDQYAKNNLAVIYLSGYENINKPNIQYAIELFNEAIRQSDDMISMYNLSNFLFYNEDYKSNTKEKIIDLLIRSSLKGFEYSKIFLCVVLVYYFEENDFYKELNKYESYRNNINEVNNIINNNMSLFQLNYIESWNEKFDYYRNNYFLYSPKIYIIALNSLPSELKEININETEKLPDEFYDGFSIKF